MKGGEFKQMIEEMNKKINSINKKLGVEVTLPETTKPKLERYSLINLVAGSGFVILGIVTGMKGNLLLGGLAIASGLFMKSEAKKK